MTIAPLHCIRRLSRSATQWARKIHGRKFELALRDQLGERYSPGARGKQNASPLCPLVLANLERYVSPIQEDCRLASLGAYYVLTGAAWHGCFKG